MNVHFSFQVPKSLDLESLIDRCNKKIDHLLTVFQPELVSLRGRITRHTPRAGTVCSLELLLPTGHFASEETATTAQAAVRAAYDDIIEQLKRHKQKLRTDQTRRGRVVEHGIGNDVAVLSPAERLTHDQHRQQHLAQYVTANIGQLEKFVQRQIRLRERMGEIAPGQLEVREVLDEMIATALSDEGAELSVERERWFYLLAANAVRKLSAQNRDGLEDTGSIHVERDATSEDLRRAERFEYIEPDDDLRVQDLMPDQRVANPEEIAYTSEMVALLDAALQRLPLQQREDLVLYALEGFSVPELALISQRSPEDVRKSIDGARNALNQQEDIPGDLRRILVNRTQARQDVA